MEMIELIVCLVIAMSLCGILIITALSKSSKCSAMSTRTDAQPLEIEKKMHLLEKKLTDQIHWLDHRTTNNRILINTFIDTEKRMRETNPTRTKI